MSGRKYFEKIGLPIRTAKFFYHCETMKKLSLVLAFPFCFAACSLDENALHGHWQAVAFYQNGQTAPAVLEAVSLDFSPEGAYVFRSAARYSEAGRYRVSARLLHLTDTTARPHRERVVRVLYLSQDSLKIEMAKSGQEQVLFLCRR